MRALPRAAPASEAVHGGLQPLRAAGQLVFCQTRVPQDQPAGAPPLPLDGGGVHAAAELGLDPDCTFKTLVLRGDKNGLFVCCIPVGEEVDLKKAAVISGNKRAEMIHVKELPVLTGYIRGGCSPIGMKKQLPTYIEETAQLFDRIAVSAGIRGQMLMLDPEELREFVGASYGEIVK